LREVEERERQEILARGGNPDYELTMRDRSAAWEQKKK
jgi:hypothetical protein